MILQRHGLLWPQEQAWPGLLAQAIQDAPSAPWRAQIQALLTLWAQQDWPLITARQSDFYQAETAQIKQAIAVGLPMPASAFHGEKIRLSMRLQARELDRQAAPLSLAQCLKLMVQQISTGKYLPTRQRKAQLAAMHELLRAAEDAGLNLQVYGSWAWQAMTGLAYLQDGSDLDLLCTPSDAQQLTAAVRIFQRVQQAIPVDGEIVFPGARAVAWREYMQAQLAVSSAGGDIQILVKTLEGARLMSCTVLSNSLLAL